MVNRGGGSGWAGMGKRVDVDGGRGGCVRREPVHVCGRRRRQRQLTAADAVAAVVVAYKTTLHVPRWSTRVGGAGERGWESEWAWIGDAAAASVASPPAFVDVGGGRGN